MADTRPPERRALDDQIRYSIETEGTSFSRMTEKERARLKSVAIATKNLKGLLALLGISDISYVHYPGYDEDGYCYFVLKRNDPRRSDLNVLITEGIQVPSWGLYNGDKIDGRLTKLWLTKSGGWLPSLSLRWLHETFAPENCGE